MRVHLKRASGEKITLDDVDAGAFTVADARAKVVESIAAAGGDVGANVRLIYKGRVLKDARTLEACGMTDDAVAHVVVSSAASGGRGETERVGVEPVPAAPTAPVGVET